jgi:hypothetical protein
LIYRTKNQWEETMHLSNLVVPYIGPSYTLVTELSVDECVRRLRDDVREPPLPTMKWGGYMPLALAQDAWLLRKLDGHQFTLLVWPFNPRFQWLFFGQIATHHRATVITGQYRLDPGSLALWFISLLLGVGIVLMVLCAVTMTLIRGTDDPWPPLGVGGIMIGLLALFVLDLRRRRREAHARERQIVALLAQLFQAREVRVPSASARERMLPKKDMQRAGVIGAIGCLLGIPFAQFAHDGVVTWPALGLAIIVSIVWLGMCLLVSCWASKHRHP